jgi:hypothetical protein
VSPVKAALFASLGSFVFMMVTELIAAGLYSVDWFSFDRLWPSLLHSGVYALGLFLALAFVIRISRRSTILAAVGGGAVGAVFGGILLTISGLVWVLTGPPSLSMLSDLFTLLQGPVTSILQELPLTVLAAVLVREWVRSRPAVDAPKEPVPAV